MRWLLKRALLIWLALIALCAVGVGIGKLDRTPDALQTLGFDVCDGEPCFRGIKPGMSWEEVRKRFPDIVTGSDYQLVVPSSMADIELSINPSDYPQDDKSVVYSAMAESRTTLPLTIGEAVARYGHPCRVEIYPDGQAPIAMVLVYPTTLIYIADPSELLFNIPLEPDYAVSMFSIVIKERSHTCDTPTTERFGIWHGFTYLRIYQTRFNKSSNFR